MCGDQAQPASVADALAMLDRALDHLTAADTAALPTAVQAQTLRFLERAAAKHTAARARVLAAFTAQDGYEDDGQGSARTWLRWQTRITTGAAAGAVGWARRLAAHPVIGDALAAGELSESWARQICAWTDRLPEGHQGDADEILAGAARGGADLAGLAGLAREMYERCHRDSDGDHAGDDGSGDRALWLDTTFGGAGRLTGDLTPGCTAALTAVLDALGKPVGPEDLRTVLQRRHDALEEACRRLVASGMLPGRAGQPTQVHLHMSLAQLRGTCGGPGASPAEAAWLTAGASQPGWVTGAEAEAAACDATVVPIVTGHVDWTALDHLTNIYLASRDLASRALAGRAPTSRNLTARDPASPEPASGDRSNSDSFRREPFGQEPAEVDRASGNPASGDLPSHDLPSHDLNGRDPASGDPAGRPSANPNARAGGPAECGCTCGEYDCPACAPLSVYTRQRLRRTLLALAVDALSGPDGLAARLRASLDGAPPTSVSLPLDIGAATETIPAHLRRAVTTRHRHCAFPGCRQPISVCNIHHIIPRSRGGPTSVGNLVPLCAFHHLTVIHRWAGR